MNTSNDGRSYGKRNGFTLIELLVVIAIISILAAILFPVFATAREKARQTTCASNEKQLGLGLLQYTQDYDEYLPYDQESSGWGTGWAHQLYPYIKSLGAFTCPNDQTKATSPNIPISYLMNRNANTNNTTYSTVAKMSAPSLTVALLEGSNTSGNPTWAGELDSEAVEGAGGSNYPADAWVCDYIGEAGYNKVVVEDTGQFAGRNVPIGNPSLGVNGAAYGLDPAFPNGRHTNGSNYLMFDGHVKALQGTMVSSGPNPANGSPTCGQDAAGCTTGGGHNAAGTAALGSTYTVTFSTL